MKQHLKALLLASALAIPGIAFGQEAKQEDTRDPGKTDAVPAPAAEESGPNSGKLSLSGGADITNAYFFRGYLQEDQGVIAQPWATVYAKLADNEDFTATAYVGTWNSVHEEKTGADDTGASAWYESDILGGVDFAFGKFTVGFIYTIYTYPNGSFDTIQEAGVKIGYNDGDFAEKLKLPFALNPYVGVYAETADANGTEDWYGEIGINPTIYTFQEGTDSAITLSLPVVVGLSLDDYYFDSDGSNETLGYASVSLVASVPLTFIPADYGSWNLIGSVQYLHLFADGLEAANSDDDDEIIGKLGVAFSY